MRIFDGDAQTRGAAIYIDNVVAPAERIHDPGGPLAARQVGHSRFIVALHFAARRVQMTQADQRAEGEVIEAEHHGTERQHQQPVGFGIALQNAEQQEID
ncbi:hypothetical protein D3C75_892660 [compost metagenome]